MPHTAKVTFTYPLPEGGQGWVSAGQVLPDDAEVVKGREALFISEASEKPAVKRVVKRTAK